VSLPDDPAPSVTPGRPRRLPRYAALLAVDVKDFSGRPGADHAGLADAIPRILDAALERYDLCDLVGEPLFEQPTGDGRVRGYDPTVISFLLNPYLKALEDELTDLNLRGTFGATASQPVRMRVSLHVGPVHDPGRDALADGNGAARIALHRLLDDNSVRKLLEQTDPLTTHVGAIVSPRVYDDAVVEGYAALAPSEFCRVAVKVKTYRGVAYVHVPRLSGVLLADGLRSVAEAPNQPAPRIARGRAKPGDSGGSERRPAAGGTVHGGITNLGSAGVAVGGDVQGSIRYGSGTDGSVSGS
jgi:hypothetical protein